MEEADRRCCADHVACRGELRCAGGDADNANNTPKGFFSTVPPPLFSGEVYYRRRVYFEGGEYRNQSDAAVNDPIQYLSANGKLVYANVVEYAMKGTVTPKAPPHVTNLAPANKTTQQPTAGD